MHVCEKREEERTICGGEMSQWESKDQPQDPAPLVPAVSGEVSEHSFQRLTSKDEPEAGLGQSLV